MEEELEIQEQLIVEENIESDDLDIYTEDGIENFIDDDGISPSEEGFMKGYLGA